RAIFGVKTGDLIVAGELADGAGERHLHVDQVDLEIVRVAIVRAPGQDMLDRVTGAFRPIDGQHNLLHDLPPSGATSLRGPGTGRAHSARLCAGAAPAMRYVIGASAHSRSPVP